MSLRSTAEKELNLEHCYFYPCGASDAGVLAVIVCVCVCVCVRRRYWIKTAIRRIRKQHHVIAQGLWFSDTKSRWWTTTLPLKFALKTTHPPFVHHNLDQYPLIAPQPWEMAKKVQLARIKSRPRAFQRAIGEPYTLPLTPPKGSTNSDFAMFSSKFQLLSTNVCCKVSSCENFQRQSCSNNEP